MSAKEKKAAEPKMTKAADAPALVMAVAVQIINELNRVHIRTPRYPQAK